MADVVVFAREGWRGMHRAMPNIILEMHLLNSSAMVSDLESLGHTDTARMLDFCIL